MQNLFRFLSSSFGSEDFFTASLAFFLDRNDEFRESFLGWIQRWGGENLRAKSWSVSVQVSQPSNAGDAWLDMVLANPEVELWFEHKVGVSIGMRENRSGQQVDQLEKYLDAAARYMKGIIDGKGQVDWPSKGPEKGHPRVLLFCITRDHSRMERGRYAGKLAESKNFGLVWPPNGHLMWKDFYLYGQESLASALNGERGEFERTLTKLFLDYWKSLPHMWLQEGHDIEWSKLLEL